MKDSPRLAHLVLTRFNCRFAGGDFPTRNHPGWLEHRFDLFERYCLPTLKAQTSKNFQWILYFDVETPPAFLERARSLFSGFPHFHLRLVELYSGEWLLADLADHLKDSCDWLLTTRLDNDDGLAADFIRRLQSEAQPGKREVLNYPTGLVLSQDRIYLSRQPSNAFLSVSEPFAGFRTALHAPHKDMGRHMPVRDLPDDPMWLQVIHEVNVSNKRRGRRLQRSAMPEGFASIQDLSRSGPRESAAAILAENLTLSLAWSARDAAAQVARRLRGALQHRA